MPLTVRVSHCFQSNARAVRVLRSSLALIQHRWRTCWSCARSWDYSARDKLHRRCHTNFRNHSACCV